MNALGDDHVSFSAAHLAVSPCGRLLLVSGDNGRLVVYETAGEMSGWGKEQASSRCSNEWLGASAAIIGLPAEQPLSVPNKLSFSPLTWTILLVFATGWAQVRSIIGLPVEQFHQFCAAWHRSGHYVFAGGHPACMVCIQLPAPDAGAAARRCCPVCMLLHCYVAAAAHGGGCLSTRAAARVLLLMPLASTIPAAAAHGSVCLFHLGSCKKVATLAAHSKNVRSLAYDAANNLLLTCRQAMPVVWVSEGPTRGALAEAQRHSYACPCLPVVSCALSDAACTVPPCLQLRPDGEGVWERGGSSCSP